MKNELPDYPPTKMVPCPFCRKEREGTRNGTGRLRGTAPRQYRDYWYAAQPCGCSESKQAAEFTRRLNAR